MSESKFLTPVDVTERYRGGVSPGTLSNWRTQKIGPSYVKIVSGKETPSGAADAE